MPRGSPSSSHAALRRWCLLVATLSACANVAGTSGSTLRVDASVETPGGAEAGASSGAGSTSSTSSTSSSGGTGFGSSTSSSSGGDCGADLGNANNCRGCGNVCPASPRPNEIAVCSFNGCGFACKPGFDDCYGSCINYTTPDACGRCNNDCLRGPDGGLGGTTPLCAPSGAGYACTASCPPDAPTNCNGACVDTTSTAMACGPSCTACATSDPHGQPACVKSTCALSCDPGYTLCDGKCVTLKTADHCGSCTVTCSADAGTPLCLPSTDGGPGSCASGCPLGQSVCNGVCVDRSTDPANCGSCGNGCGTSIACSQGVCGGSMCGPGTTLCQGSCVDTTNWDPSCGPCGTRCQCPSGNCSTSIRFAHPRCVSGECSFACNAGYTLCNRACVDELSDDYNCGGCGAPCTSPATCQGGQCK